MSSSTHVGLLDTSRTTTQTERRSISHYQDARSQPQRCVKRRKWPSRTRHVIVSDGLKPNTLMLVAATEKVWPLEFLLASTCALMTSSHLPSTAARMRTRHATCPHESSGADAIVSEWNQHAFHLARVASGPITGVRKSREGCEGGLPEKGNRVPLRSCWNESFARSPSPGVPALFVRAGRIQYIRGSFFPPADPHRSHQKAAHILTSPPAGVGARFEQRNGA